MVLADGVGWISLASDCTSFWRRWRGGSLGAGQWLRSLLDARSYSWYEKADPEPATTAAVRSSGMDWRIVSGGRESANADPPATRFSIG